MVRVILCFMVTLFFSSAPLRAETTYVAPSFVAPLMRWVSVRMNVPVKALPRVTVSRERMVEKIGVPQRLSALGQSAIARALYVPGEVVMDDQFWDADDPRVVSFLVHELVHHAQMASGRSYACHNAKEWEAYTLQNGWLVERGLPAAVEKKWIARMADCRVSHAVK